MAEPDVQYTVRDRSLLLPWYKRAVVDPVVRRLPARLHPNTITHGGHLVNLAGLCAVLALAPATRGGPSLVYLVPALTLHVYNLCDNADGAHARATGQTSPLGELLDHGLDLLNVAYIALLGALAIGATPLWTTAMVTSVTGAAAAVYWEQAETGVFQLGLLNQVEATFLLAAVLVACAVFGPGVVGGLSPLPGSAFTVRTVTAAVVTLGAVAAMLHGALRVARRGGALAPFATLALFGAGAVALVASGALPWPAGAALGATGYVFVGLRNLTLRMRGRRPLRETGVLVLALASLGLSAAAVAGHDVHIAARGVALLGAASLVALGAFHGRRGLRDVTSRASRAS